MPIRKLIWIKVFICTIFMVSLVSAAFTRQHYSINALAWKFKKADAPGAEKTAFDEAGWANVTIPHDFNGGIDKINDDIFSGPKMYRGIGWYRVHFTVDSKYQGKQVFVEFEAVSLVADVWLNGVSLGQHKGGYTGFSFDITSQVTFGADNVLAIKANSANDPKVAPWMQVPFGLYPRSYDYGVYGGIYRDVWITITDKAKIEAAYITTPGVSAASSTVRVKTEVTNYGTAPQSVTLSTNVTDAAGTVVKTMETTQSIDAGQVYTFDQTSADIANPQLWSPDNPYLYKVKSTLTVGAENIDQFESPLGFRWFTPPTPNKAFQLNGANLFIRGVNRHQDRDGFGYALTNEQHRFDAQLMKNAGFNFMRHAHYPADAAIMQACNELGIMVWLEIPVTCAISTDPDFLANAKSQLTEMIKQNYNNPSVIVWGVGNESDQGAGSVNPNLSEGYTNTFHKALSDVAHQVDATRPTTGCNWKFASNHATVDAYSPQDWQGWYGGVYQNYAPTSLIGEYGADAAIERHKEPGSQAMNDWSQEYQCLLHEAFVSRGESRKTQFPGHCTWILADFGSPRSDRVINGGGNTIDYMNQKGLLLHDHVTPKDVYYFYQSFYTDGAKAPMVYIVSHTWKNRWTAAAAKNVWVYSNCEQVELFNAIESESFGKRTRDAGENTIKTRFQWNNANVKYNILYAEGYVNNKVVARDTITLLNLPKAPVTETGKASLQIQPAQVKMALVETAKGTGIRLSLNRTMDVTIQLYAMDGSLVSAFAPQCLPAGAHQLSVSPTNLAHGLYYARIIADGANWSQNIILR
jgi:beta-galactosidase